MPPALQIPRSPLSLRTCEDTDTPRAQGLAGHEQGRTGQDGQGLPLCLQGPARRLPESGEGANTFSWAHRSGGFGGVDTTLARGWPPKGLPG